MPQLGATFVPGGYDDYYMPEVVAPAPQRVMPEVPQNIQEDIQRLELEARDTERSRPGATDSGAMNAPSPSPFPKVKGKNIPPSHEEKGETLKRQRESILNSQFAQEQFAWAREVLLWVEIAQDARARESRWGEKGMDRPETPDMERQLRNDAKLIIEHLVDQKHAEATFTKGKWFEFGKFGMEENKQEAYRLYKKAAEDNYGRAEYRMGMLYENSNDIPNAIRHYTVGATWEDSASRYRLGMMYLMGQHGYQRDYHRGLELIQLAADSADEDAPQGAYVYGMLIARELPDINIPENVLPYDLTLAKYYVERAANLSFAKAQLKMGQAYELSQLGCDFNPAYSLHYYALAALQGQPEASLGVSRWFLFGYEDVFPKNEQLAFKYAQDAAEAGLPTGEFAMGYYYEIGIHVPKDTQEARRWYELAAEHGNKDARDRLESLNQSRTLTKQDHETTTLTRIKSQHGSQRGKRPERFARRNDVMPTVNEGDQTRGAGVDYPNSSPRQPAFGLNVDPSGLPMRPRSAAPYAHEEQPSSPGFRPRSAAPYPEDDVNRGPHLSPSGRVPVGAGPYADRPGSAFGIRTVGPNPGVQPSAGRGRPGAEDQWQQPPYPQNDQRYGAASVGPGIVPAGTMPVGDPPRGGRLQKPNPNMPGLPSSPRPTTGGFGTAGGSGNRTVSSNYGYDRQGPSSPPASGRVPTPTGSPANGGNLQAPAGGPARPVSQTDSSPAVAGRASAPPAQNARPSASPGPAPSQRPGGRPPPSDMVHPDGKTFGQGPATFEEMGIPQGKTESDCVIM